GAEPRRAGLPLREFFDQLPVAGVPDPGPPGVSHGDHPVAVGTDRDVGDIGAAVETNRLAWPVGVQNPSARIGFIGADRPTTGDDGPAVAALADAVAAGQRQSFRRTRKPPLRRYLSNWPAEHATWAQHQEGSRRLEERHGFWATCWDEGEFAA